MAAASSSQSVRVDIISIGTLSRNRLWNEAAQVRTAHATTTLVRAGKRNILVDPGLPPQAIAARLNERTGLTPDKIDTVFLTNFRAAHRRGLEAFASAKVYLHEVEQVTSRQQLEALIEQAPEADLDRAHLQRDLTLLNRMSAAEDKVAEHVDLFPLFGYTAGTTGLLVWQPTTTILISGDAVPTREHFLA